MEKYDYMDPAAGEWMPVFELEDEPCEEEPENAGNSGNAENPLNDFVARLILDSIGNGACAVNSIPLLDRIRYQDRATTVFWADGTKTSVRCGEGETFSRYTGFIAAVAKKLFGSTSQVKKICEEFDEDFIRAQEKAQRDREEAQAREARARRMKKRVRRLARRMALEMRAKKLAKEMAAREEDA